MPMSRVLVVYCTVEGHTARIAGRIARALGERGHTVQSLRAEATGTDLDPAAFDAVIIGASIHYGRHPGYLRALVRRHREALASRPSAFFSVSLSAGGPGAKPAAAQRYLERFLRQTGWRPHLSANFAGALCYSRYGAFKRLLMIAFVGLAGGNTDTSRDYEYTDWEAVDRFSDAFARQIPLRSS
jgi:menaquinone-dependent protoporphyrinogen oxidase